jgi:hypothetical protein
MAARCELSRLPDKSDGQNAAAELSWLTGFDGPRIGEKLMRH